MYLIITITSLKSIGHLDATYKDSMLSAYLSFFQHEFSICYIIGCASNSIIIGGTEIEGNFTDNGFIRTSYFFGVPWLIFYFILINQAASEEDTMIMKLKDGDVKIELFNDVAPNHVKRFKKLVEEKKYDGVVFHRVIDGFMAQTGDVKFGNVNKQNLI